VACALARAFNALLLAAPAVIARRRCVFCRSGDSVGFKTAGVAPVAAVVATAIAATTATGTFIVTITSTISSTSTCAITCATSTNTYTITCTTSTPTTVAGVVQTRAAVSASL